MDKLRLLDIFIASCDAGSFAAAAKSCNTDPSTVSKAINRLEAELGFTLFQRSTRQLSITAAGRRYADTVRKLLQDLSLCEHELKHLNDSPGSTLRINSAACYGHLYLQPLLQAFCQRYPAIKLQLEINDLHVDIIDNDIDVALRTGLVKDSRLVARRLSPMDFLICAAPEYLAARGTPRCAQPATRLGQTSVSISRPTSGRKCAKKRPTAEGVSHGCQTCTSPGCSKALPASRPVAVPWVSTRRMPGRLSRKRASKATAARVSPSDTACNQTTGAPPAAAAG